MLLWFRAKMLAKKKYGLSALYRLCVKSWHIQTVCCKFKPNTRRVTSKKYYFLAYNI